MLNKNLLLLSITMALYSQTANANANTPLIFGNTYITAGESAKIQGNVQALTYLVTGANAQLGSVNTYGEVIVESDIQTGTTVTTGAASLVTGNIQVGTAITLGAATIVGHVADDKNGAACAGTALTLGAAVIYNARFVCDASNPEVMTYSRTKLVNAKTDYSSLTSLDINSRNVLESMISLNTVLSSSDAYPTTDHHSTNGKPTYVYNTSSLTTGADIEITLDGDVNWVFNIENMLSLGEGSEIKLASESKGSVTWNVGGYTSLGESSTLVGTVLSNGYVSTGMGSTVTAAPSSSGDYCGGLFSADSYVTIGARGAVNGCKIISE